MPERGFCLFICSPHRKPFGPTGLIFLILILILILTLILPLPLLLLILHVSIRLNGLLTLLAALATLRTLALR
jgi:hypothetical protein